jgi:hypothetical protein
MSSQVHGVYELGFSKITQMVNLLVPEPGRFGYMGVYREVLREKYRIDREEIQYKFSITSV